MKDYYIREIENDDIEKSAEIIRESFFTVAQDFKLTKENCATNGAFIETDKLLRHKARGIKMFGLFKEELQIGFVGIVKLEDGAFEMEKLSVLPQYRHNSYGTVLVNFVIDYVKALKGNKIKIGIIEENLVLKQWYLALGFVEKGTKVFEHLPFTVGFMELPL